MPLVGGPIVLLLLTAEGVPAAAGPLPASLALPTAGHRPSRAVLAAFSEEDVPVARLVVPRSRYRLRGFARAPPAASAALQRARTGAAEMPLPPSGRPLGGQALDALRRQVALAATTAAQQAAAEERSVPMLTGPLPEAAAAGDVPPGVAAAAQPPLSDSQAFLEHFEDQLSERLRVENDRLREENGRLRGQEAVLNREEVALRRGDQALRAEHGMLQMEDTRLRQQAAALSTALARARQQGPPHTSVAMAMLGAKAGQQVMMSQSATCALIVVLGSLLTLSFFYLACCMPSDETDSESDSEEDEEDMEQKLRTLLKPEKDKRSGWCTCWFCNRQVLLFFFGVSLLSFVGGCILWEMGILQPILSQVLMYVYVAVVIAAFVGLIVSQLWRIIRRTTSYIMREFEKLRGVFRIFHGKTRYKIRDFLDDGVLNNSYQDPRKMRGR